MCICWWMWVAVRIMHGMSNIGFLRHGRGFLQYVEKIQVWLKSDKVNLIITWSRSYIFVVAPCMLIVLSPSFVQLIHTNCYKIVKQLISFKIIIVAPACFGLHKLTSGSCSLCFAKGTMLTSFTYRYIKLSVLWLHMQPQYHNFK